VTEYKRWIEACEYVQVSLDRFTVTAMKAGASLQRLGESFRRSALSNCAKRASKAVRAIGGGPLTKRERRLVDAIAKRHTAKGYQDE